MRLLFVRHGETNWNVEKKIQGSTDTDLNEQGIEQARMLGEKLSEENVQIHTIYSSKLKRAAKTAEIIGSIIGANVKHMDGLEEISLGQWEGMRWVEVQEKYPEEFVRWHENRRYQRPPKGESYQDLLNRVVPAIKNIMQKKTDTDTALVVTHSANIVTLLAVIHNVPFQDMFKTYRIGNTAVIEVDSKDILNAEFLV